MTNDTKTNAVNNRGKITIRTNLGYQIDKYYSFMLIVILYFSVYG